MGPRRRQSPAACPSLRGSEPPISSSPSQRIAWPPPNGPGSSSTIASCPRARSAPAMPGEPRLERQRPARRVSVEPPARRVERGLRVEPVVDQRRDELQVALRLHVSAHQPERPQQPVVAQQHPGDDRVERPPAGGEAVRVPGLEREAGPAVLQGDAGSRGADAASRSRSRGSGSASTPCAARPRRTGRPCRRAGGHPPAACRREPDRSGRAAPPGSRRRGSPAGSGSSAM